MAELAAPQLLVVDRMGARGGQELALVEYATLLAARAPQVAILPLHSSEPVNGAPFTILPAPEGSLRRRDQELVRAVADRRAEGWFVQSFVPLPGAQLFIPRGGLVREALQRRARSQRGFVRRTISSLSYPHSPNKSRLLMREAQLFAEEEGARLVALSSYVEEQAERHYGVSGERIRRIPNGIDLERLRGAAGRAAGWRDRLGLDTKTPLFVSAAQNFRLKGIPTLMRALRELGSGRPWAAVIAGGEGEGVASRLDGRVRFLGAVDDVPGLLAAATLVVHPSFYDPMSRVGLEALALNVPLLSSRYDGVLDLLPAEAPRLRDPADARELTRHLSAALDDPPKPADIDPERLSMKRHVDGVVELIAELEA